MKFRTFRISSSIADAIVEPEWTYEDEQATRGTIDKSCKALAAFFSLYRLGLTRYRDLDFHQLRFGVWGLDEQLYRDSFGVCVSNPGTAQLKPAGDLGYSGSTFFVTPNDRFLVKSLPRSFEHRFFTQDLLDGYAAHMTDYPNSLLVRILDTVYAPRLTLGGLLGVAPTHHIIMENLLHRQQDDRGPERNDDAGREHQEGPSVETFDLKPDDYFFPERDVADGRLAPESVKDRLVDKFPGEVRVSAAARRELFALLESDTLLLASTSAVDYSLFLVRFPVGALTTSPFDDAETSPCCWRTGVESTDGQWIYRAVLLDFFWAKKKMRAKAMTGLINAFNLIAKKGPMSITTHPFEYRTRFLTMVDKLVPDASPGSGGDGSSNPDDSATTLT